MLRKCASSGAQTQHPHAAQEQQKRRNKLVYNNNRQEGERMVNSKMGTPRPTFVLALGGKPIHVPLKCVPGYLKTAKSYKHNSNR